LHDRSHARQQTEHRRALVEERADISLGLSQSTFADVGGFGKRSVGFGVLQSHSVGNSEWERK
jgi:hypothetical protein